MYGYRWLEVKRGENMALFDFKDFFKVNKEDYEAEAKDAQSLQDSIKEFNQQIPPNAALEMKLASFLAGLSKESDSNFEEGDFSGGEYSGTLQEQFWQYFTAAGFSKEATAGMMGNIQQESSFKPSTKEAGGPKEGYGLIQWSFERKTNLLNYAKSKGKTPDDSQMQFDFLLKEMTSGGNWTSKGGKYPYDKFKTTNDVDWATDAFCWAFERPKVSKANISGRKKYAKQYYNEFKNKEFSKDAQLTATKGSAPFGGGRGGFIKPAPGSIRSPFGYRIHPISKKRKLHGGLDISRGGKDIVAAAPGVVTKVTYHDSWGKYVKIKHGKMNGKETETLYAHMSKQLVNVGQKVNAGQKIGIQGETGAATGVHLHFEIYENGTRVDPSKYVDYPK